VLLNRGNNVPHLLISDRLKSEFVGICLKKILNHVLAKVTYAVINFICGCFQIIKLVNELIELRLPHDIRFIGSGFEAEQSSQPDLRYFLFFNNLGRMFFLLIIYNYFFLKIF